MYQYKRKEILFNSFSNISEYYNYITKTPKRPSADNSSEDNGKSFSGTESLEEAYKLLLSGDDDLYQKYKGLEKLSIEKILGNVINRPKQKNDVVGFQANVPQYLLGLPTNMINQEPKKTSQKVLNIVLSIGVSAYVSKQEIEKVGNLYIQVLDLLEKAGYRVNLYTLHAVDTHHNEDVYCIVRIKTDREPFNIKKSIFPIMHPSYLRRVGFRYNEVCDIDNIKSDFTQSGYGCPITDKKELRDKLNKILKTDFIVWRFQQDFANEGVEKATKKILKELKEDYGIDVLGEEV